MFRRSPVGGQEAEDIQNVHDSLTCLPEGLHDKKLECEVNKGNQALRGRNTSVSWKLSYPESSQNEKERLPDIRKLSDE